MSRQALVIVIRFNLSSHPLTLSAVLFFCVCDGFSCCFLLAYGPRKVCELIVTSACETEAEKSAVPGKPGQ
jgi:hypothetical protein